MPIPSVVFSPRADESIGRGIGQMVAAVRPTLGPRPRMVAVERAARNSDPELLDDAGVIARRVIQLPDRSTDMGAMLVRKLLWQMHERAGDGAATAAVLCEAVYRGGRTYVAAGGNAMRLRHYLEAASHAVTSRLDEMSRPIAGTEQLTAFALSVCHEPELAAVLGEAIDILGDWGALDVRPGQGREHVRQYVTGAFWDGGLLAPELAVDAGHRRTDLTQAAILMTDHEIQLATDLVPVLRLAHENGIRSLAILARSIAPQALALLLGNRRAGAFELFAAKTPEINTDVQGPLQDVAALAGGRPFFAATGESLERVRLEDLGRARRAWANAEYFGISGGGGDARSLRGYLAGLQEATRRAADPAGRRELRARAGKLLGGSATLWVGGATGVEIEVRKGLAERTAEALRSALAGGVVAGGGAALLDCRSALDACAGATGAPEERAAYRVLASALEAPTRAIIGNAGGDPAAVLGRIAEAGPGHGYDAETGRVADMVEAGVLDSAAVLGSAVAGAVSTAAMALTTSVLVHHRSPEASYDEA